MANTQMVPVGPDDQTRVYCDSHPIKTVGHNALGQGWIYGFHMLRDKPPANCPRCGAVLGRASGVSIP